LKKNIHFWKKSSILWLISLNPLIYFSKEISNLKWSLSVAFLKGLPCFSCSKTLRVSIPASAWAESCPASSFSGFFKKEIYLCTNFDQKNYKRNPDSRAIIALLFSKHFEFWESKTQFL